MSVAKTNRVQGSRVVYCSLSRVLNIFWWCKAESSKPRRSKSRSLGHVSSSSSSSSGSSSSSSRRDIYKRRITKQEVAEPQLSVGPISSTQTTDLTHRKVKNLDPQTNPTHNPIELHRTNNKPSGTRTTILIYHRQWIWKFIRYYSFISIYHYQVIRYYFSSHKQ